MTSDLFQLRLKLTAWYVVVFALVLVAFAAATLYVTTREMSRSLDRSLAAATEAVVTAAQIREREGETTVNHVDALDELYIPDRILYVFDDRGTPLHPDSASEWLKEAALAAGSSGRATREQDMQEPQTAWRAYARRFVLRDGRAYVAVAAADVIEVEDRYPNIITGFAVAAVAALALAGAGGWILARRSVMPVESAITRMRNFMADAAHELRTPVAVVKGHAEVALRRPRERAEYTAALQAIYAETGRLAGVLENVLMLSRADSGEWPINKEVVFLDDIVLDAVEAARALAGDRDLAISINVLDEVAIRGDRSLLRQLIMILLDNAVKFTPDGGAVTVSTIRAGNIGILSVQDTGPGIPASQVANLFDRFTRGDNARQSTGGAGLGLSIARWIAGCHDATLYLNPSCDPGADMRVSFRLQSDVQ